MAAVSMFAWSGVSLATSELQSDTEQGVLAVCGGFVQNDDATTPEQQDLFARCGEMVHNSRELGRVPEGPEDASLGLDNEALDAAYQQLAAEETSAPGTMVTETSNLQSAAILSRLSTLRGAGPAVAAAPGRDGGGPVVLAALDDRLRLSQADDAMSLTGDWTPEAHGRRVGLFVNANYGFGDKDGTDNEDGFDYDSAGLTAGADYRLSEALVLGGAVGYSRLEADFDRNPEVAGGSVDADSYNLFGYGLYSQQQFYLHGLIGYTRSDFDIDRRIRYQAAPGSSAEGADRTARADTDGDQFQVSVGGGYEIRRDALTLTPTLRLEYLDASIDSYRESGAEGLVLAVEDQDVESFTSALGIQAAYTTSQSYGALVPQARVEWIHEFSDDGRRIETQYVHDPRSNVLVLQTDDPDRNYALIGIGLSAVFRTGLQAFVDYETLQGLSDIDSHMIRAGIRLEM